MDKGNISPKDRIINRMFNVIQGQAMLVKDDVELSKEDKLIQMDILLDLKKFLKDYDENVQILNKHQQQKHHQLTVEQMKQIEKEDMGYIGADR